MAMREQEMRMRVFRFLSVRMRNMILPATVGIGLAVGGACSRTESTPVYSAPLPGDAAAVRQDAPNLPDDRGRDTASLPDVAAPDLFQPGPDLPTGRDVLADAASDAASAEDRPSPADRAINGDLQPSDGVATEAELHRDAMPDFGGMKYIAPFFDAASPDGGADMGGMKYVAPFPDASPVDAPADLGTVTTKYLAQLPDAAPDNTPALRYMAQMPDAAPGPVALYMAPAPGGA
jgi:hypothetical protein